jgi:hypothetical protein
MAEVIADYDGPGALKEGQGKGKARQAYMGAVPARFRARRGGRGAHAGPHPPLPLPFSPLPNSHSNVAGTPYEGGSFRLRLDLGPDFPAGPPKGTFLTKLFHPNVSAAGEVCVNVLKKDWKVCGLVCVGGFLLCTKRLSHPPLTHARQRNKTPPHSAPTTSLPPSLHPDTITA